MRTSQIMWPFYIMLLGACTLLALADLTHHLGGDTVSLGKTALARSYNQNNDTELKSSRVSRPAQVVGVNLKDYGKLLDEPMHPYCLEEVKVGLRSGAGARFGYLCNVNPNFPRRPRSISGNHLPDWSNIYPYNDS